MSTLSSSNHKVAVITGTSGNLGTNIAKRLIVQLPSTTRLTIVVTSRTLSTANKCIKDLHEFAETIDREGIVDFDYCLIDFTNMVSVLNAVYELSKNHDKIDYLFINAAQGVYDGIDWGKAIIECCTNPIKGVTYPTYKIQRVGVKSKDDLGLVFQVNVFAPYYLIQKLIENKLFKKELHPKVIWISSVMSKPEYLDLTDLQLLQSDESYEGSKRLVDLIHLATFKTLLKDYGVVQYLTHPGIFTSFSFFEFLNPFTYYGMLMLFYIARFLGSPWHNISGWNAANAPLVTALETDPKLDSLSIKYGSATSWNGEEYIKTTPVESTGADVVLKYFEKLKSEWDDKLKNQIRE